MAPKSSFSVNNPPIKIARSPLVTSAFPFENTPAGITHTWVTEIIRIHVECNNAGGGSLIINRGQSAAVEANDPSVILNAQFSANNTLDMEFTDGAGNGLLVPESSLFATIGSSTFAKIFYKMRLVENEDLFMYFANFNKA